ncbi:hypothetical protein C2E23DRAFT_901973 [Lenzites betulinus]|nr:hypothetical protein C2E23DRAFT_901973 [Lenzites betulinus]
MAKHAGKGKGKATRYNSAEDSDEQLDTQLPLAKKARLATRSSVSPDRRTTASGSGNTRSSSPYVNPFARTSETTQSSGGRGADERAEVSAKAKRFKDPGAGRSQGQGTKANVIGALARLAAASSGRDSGKDSEASDPGGSRGGADYIGGGAAALFSAKRMGDQFMSIRTKLEDMAQDIRKQDASLEDVKHQLHAAIGELESIDATVGGHTKELRTTLNGVLNHEERIASLEGRLETALAKVQDTSDAKAASDGESEAPVRRVKGEKERDNCLQDAVRKCLCCMMGIAFGGPLPRPCASTGTYWERIYEMNMAGTAVDDAQRYLRPDWERPWSDNQSGWSVRVCKNDGVGALLGSYPLGTLVRARI